MALIVHAAGTQSLLVDFGRPGWRGLGVPLGGAADRTGLAIANALVGNEADAVGLEFALAGPTLESTAEHAGVVYGAGFHVHIDDRPQPLGKTFTLRPGQVLTIGATEIGLRGYLAIASGFDAPVVLGSRSSLFPAARGDELRCSTCKMLSRFWQPDDRPTDDRHLLHVVEGTHTGQFDRQRWVSQTFIVSPDSNRMGLRLQSDALPRPTQELLSAPVTPGTVQVTNDGQTIVLGVDAQTIGGYPRIAHVISADLDKLGQLRPGAKVRFHWVDLDTATRLFHEKSEWLRRTTLRLRSSLLR
jgi:antagonist of KipI